MFAGLAPVGQEAVLEVRRALLSKLKLRVHDFHLGPVVLDPADNVLKLRFDVAAGISDGHDSQAGRAPDVLVFDFGRGDVELAMEPGQERFEQGAFLL